MQMKAENRTALITGVSSGIGRALALYFQRKGVQVIGVSRHEPDFPMALWISADITTPEGRSEVRRRTEAFTGGKLDLLLNNAGMGIYASWEEMTEEDLRKVFELDFFAPVLLTKELLELLHRAQPGSSIINVSSSASRLWIPCMGGYCAVKAALSMFSNSLRTELACSGIHVMDVLPGQISTGFSSRACGTRRPPDAPGAKDSADGLAASVYRAWKGRRRILVYPGWIGIGAFILRNMVPGLYDRISRKIWHLDG